jgi:MFS family permease
VTPTIVLLLVGLDILLVGVGLLGTLLGVRAALESFGNAETGLIMTGYYVGYILGTLLGPRIVRQVGHIRAFATFAALAAASALAFGLWIDSWAWLLLRILNGAAVVGVYMVVESWLNAQTPGIRRGRVFAGYMLSTLAALAAGQFLLLTYHPQGLELFALAALLLVLGLIPVAATRVSEPRIELAATLHLSHLYRLSPLGAVGSFGAGAVSGAFWGMTAVFAQRIGMSAAEIATLMSATILGGVMLQLPIGHFSDRHDRRTVLIVVSLCSAAAALLAAWLVYRELPGLVPVAFVYGGLMFSLYGLSVAHTNDQIQADQVLAATRGLLLLYGLGAVSGPLLGGLMMDRFGPLGLPVLSAVFLLLLAGFGLYRITRRTAPATADQGAFVPLVRTTPVALEMHPEAELEPELDLAGGKPDRV